MNQRLLHWLFFLLACYFPLFLHLDNLSLRLWDESRQAVNALEMIINDNILVTHFDGAPDLWNVKPPFVIWCQALMMEIVGINELAIRLPSALAGLASAILLVIFSDKVLKNRRLGFIAGLILVTAMGFVNNHGTRSGDYDAMLTLWETLYLLCFFTYLEVNDLKLKKRLLIGTGVTVVLAVLTKGIAGLFFLPGLAIYTIIQKKLLPTISNRQFWSVVTISIAIIASYYLLRETVSSGYFAAVYKYELGGRYLETLGGHANDRWYYLRDFYNNDRFMPWLFFLPLGMAIGYMSTGRVRRLTLLFTINITFILIFLSFGATRLRWYMNPLYPNLALLVAFGIEKALNGVVSIVNTTTCKRYVVSSLFLLALFFIPYKNILDKYYLAKDDQWEWQKTQYRDFINKNQDFTNYTILYPQYNGHLIFYQRLSNWQKETKIQREPLRNFLTNEKRVPGKDILFNPTEQVMICEKEALKALNNAYVTKTINEWKSCKLVAIIDKKS